MGKMALVFDFNNGRYNCDNFGKNNFDNRAGSGAEQVVEIKEEEKKEEEEEKTNDNPNNDDEAVEPEPKAVQYDGGNPNKSESLTGAISYAGVSGGNLIVRVNIDQFLASGKCELNILKDGTSAYNEITTIESSVSTSTCNGFSVPLSELASGKYAIEVNLESDGKYGKMVGEVTI